MRDLPYRPLNQRGLIAETLQNLIVTFVIVLIFAGMYYYRDYNNHQLVHQNAELQVEKAVLDNVIQQHELGTEIKTNTEKIEDRTTDEMVVQEKVTQTKVTAIKKTTTHKVAEIEKNDGLTDEEKHIAVSQVMYDQLHNAYCMADPDACKSS